MAGDQVVDRLSGAAVRHVVELDVGRLGEPLHQHVLVRADARGRAAHAGRFLHRGDQLGHRIHLERGVHGEHLRLAPEQAHRHQILEEVDVQLQHMRRACHVVVGEQERIAVGRRLDRGVDADRAAGAGAVLDEHLLAEPARDVFAGEPRDEVEPAAGRERHDEAHRPVRPVLRARDMRGEQCRAQCARALDELPPSDAVHCASSVHIFVAAVLPRCLILRQPGGAAQGSLPQRREISRCARPKRFIPAAPIFGDARARSLHAHVNSSSAPSCARRASTPAPGAIRAPGRT